MTDARGSVYHTSLHPLLASASGREAAIWQPQLFPDYRTNAYIYGFNLYYRRALRQTSFRWLDIGKLARLLLPQHQIELIRYFTARIDKRHGDPTQPQRQQTFLRALETIPNLSIHYGHFLSKKKRRPLAQPRVSGPRTVEILDTEEKGSDVNLASYLLLDGFENQYDLVVVISNDSDLMTPIKMGRTKLGKQVGIFDPSRKRSFELYKASSWYRSLRQGPLSASLFPDTISDTQGPITKPSGW